MLSGSPVVANVAPFSVLAGNCHMSKMADSDYDKLAAAILLRQQQQQEQLSSNQQRLADSEISTRNAGKSSLVYTYK